MKVAPRLIGACFFGLPLGFFATCAAGTTAVLSDNVSGTDALQTGFLTWGAYVLVSTITGVALADEHGRRTLRRGAIAELVTNPVAPIIGFAPVAWNAPALWWACAVTLILWLGITAHYCAYSTEDRTPEERQADGETFAQIVREEMSRGRDDPEYNRPHSFSERLKIHAIGAVMVAIPRLLVVMVLAGIVALLVDDVTPSLLMLLAVDFTVATLVVHALAGAIFTRTAITHPDENLRTNLVDSFLATGLGFVVVAWQVPAMWWAAAGTAVVQLLVGFQHHAHTTRDGGVNFDAEAYTSGKVTYVPVDLQRKDDSASESG